MVTRQQISDAADRFRSLSPQEQEQVRAQLANQAERALFNTLISRTGAQTKQLSFNRADPILASRVLAIAGGGPVPQTRAEQERGEARTAQRKAEAGEPLTEREREILEFQQRTTARSGGREALGQATLTRQEESRQARLAIQGAAGTVAFQSGVETPVSPGFLGRIEQLPRTLDFQQPVPGFDEFAFGIEPAERPQQQIPGDLPPPPEPPTQSPEPDRPTEGFGLTAIQPAPEPDVPIELIPGEALSNLSEQLGFRAARARARGESGFGLEALAFAAGTAGAGVSTVLGFPRFILEESRRSVGQTIGVLRSPRREGARLTELGREQVVRGAASLRARPGAVGGQLAGPVFAGAILPAGLRAAATERVFSVRAGRPTTSIVTRGPTFSFRQVTPFRGEVGNIARRITRRPRVVEGTVITRGEGVAVPGRARFIARGTAQAEGAEALRVFQRGQITEARQGLVSVQTDVLRERLGPRQAREIRQQQVQVIRPQEGRRGQRALGATLQPSIPETVPSRRPAFTRTGTRLSTQVPERPIPSEAVVSRTGRILGLDEPVRTEIRFVRRGGELFERRRLIGGQFEQFVTAEAGASAREVQRVFGRAPVQPFPSRVRERGRALFRSRRGQLAISETVLERQPVQRQRRVVVEPTTRRLLTREEIAAGIRPPRLRAARRAIELESPRIRRPGLAGLGAFVGFSRLQRPAQFPSTDLIRAPRAGQIPEVLTQQRPITETFPETIPRIQQVPQQIPQQFLQSFLTPAPTPTLPVIPPVVPPIIPRVPLLPRLPQGGRQGRRRRQRRGKPVSKFLPSIGRLFDVVPEQAAVRPTRRRLTGFEQRGIGRARTRRRRRRRRSSPRRFVF